MAGKGGRPLTIQGQLEIAIGNVGDSCDYLYLVRHHAGQVAKYLDLAYGAGSIAYRGLVALKDGSDPGAMGIPPRERESGRRWLPSEVAA